MIGAALWVDASVAMKLQWIDSDVLENSFHQLGVKGFSGVSWDGYANTPIVYVNLV